jgi:hypothetical protein
MSYTDDQLDAVMRRFTPKQRARLARLERLPWRWFVSDQRYFALVDEYDRDASIRYWRVLSRVTSYEGPDYRVHNGHAWIRATRLQYEQADHLGVQRSIGVPLQIAA